MKPTFRQLREVESNRVVVARLTMADTAWKRAVGLLGRSSLADDEALWIEPCSGIHTFGMRFTLDIVFLDQEGRALRFAPAVRPWRIRGPVRGARTVLELPAGAISRLNLQLGRRYQATSRRST